MASIDDLADVECGSEEVPFTAAKFVRGLDVPLSPSDGSDSYITDIIKLSDDRLLVAHHHGRVYTVSSKNEVDRKWDLKNYIHSVTEASDGCYVAAYYNFYMFKDDSAQISTRKGSSDNQSCVQMRLMDNNQVVSHKDGRLVISMLRNDSRKFCVDLEPNPRNEPRFMRLVKENDSSVIYTSGEISDTTYQLVKLSVNGEVLNVYKNWEFSDARSMTTTGDGHVFLCYPEEDCIQLLTPQMDRGVTVLDSSNGLENPTAIYYCSDKRKLYVANNYKHNIYSKVKNIMTFDVKY